CVVNLHGAFWAIYPSTFSTCPRVNSAKKERGMPEAVCGGGGGDQSPITVANGNHAIPGRSPRIGVTSEEAENAPRLRVPYGEDAKESAPPGKRRVETHTPRAQDSSTPVSERWRSRAARRRGSHRPRCVGPTGATVVS